MSSIVQILQVELMALIEYAKAVHMEMDDQHTKLLRSAITALALSEVNSDSGYVDMTSGGPKPKFHIPTKEEKETERARINANAENDDVWNPTQKKIVRAIGGDQAALDKVYKSYGSPVAMLKWDMHLTKQNSRNLGASETISDGIAYFVPIGPILYKTRQKDKNGNDVAYKDLIDAGRMTLDQAITEVCGKENLVCNFNVNAVKDDTGPVYINGGALGLDLLAGTPQHKGMLASMDERFANVTYRSKIAKPRRKLGDTEYRIQLTHPEAVAFTEMILDPTSILRTKYIQLTAVRTIGETNDTVEQTGTEEENYAQHRLDDQMSKGHEEFAAGQEDVYGPAMQTWNESLDRIRKQISQYIDYPDTNKPKLDFHENTVLDSKADPLTLAMQKVQYISRFAVAFGKSFDVDVPMRKCQVEHVTYDIANYSETVCNTMNSKLNSYKIKSHAALFNMSNMLNENVARVLGNIDTRILSFYENAKFDTEETTEEIAHNQQIKAVRSLWSDVMHRKFVGKDGHTYTVNSLINMLSRQIERDNGSTRSLPPKVASLYNDLVTFDHRIQLDKDLPTPDDIEPAVEYIVEPLIKIYAAEVKKPKTSESSDAVTPTKKPDGDEVPNQDNVNQEDNSTDDTEGSSDDDDDETMKMFMAMI